MSHRDVWPQKKVRGRKATAFAARGERTSPRKQVPPEGNSPMGGMI